MNTLKQSFVVILAIILLFVVTQTPLEGWIPYILGFIAGVSCVYAFFRKRIKKHKETFIGSNKEIFTILIFVILIVFLTGGISSNFFFLIYFLMFGITFVFEPVIIFLFIFGLLALFIPGTLQDDVFSNVIKLSSLVILTPVAYFFAREYNKRETLQNKANQTFENIITEATELLETNDKDKRIKKTEEIIHEAERLRDETKDNS